MTEYRVLTIKQPYAGLIALGFKTLETRSWATNYRGQLLIQASASPDKPMLEKYHAETKHPSHLVTTNSAFLCLVDLVSCFKQSALLDNVNKLNRTTMQYSHWNIDEPFAWKLENPRILRISDTPVKGRLGIWKWEGEL